MLDYQSILKNVGDCSPEATIAFLTEELPYLWYEAYKTMTPRLTSVVRVKHNSFEYIFDNYSHLESQCSTADGCSPEDRLVGVLGRSAPKEGARDDYRLKGWVGPTETVYGSQWDKGHFIAHSIGGSIDRLEVNAFVQRRDLNRGWSLEGKRFRAMERYCETHPGTFCFSRPLYIDQTARPGFVEFGVLRHSRDLWVERFDNHSQEGIVVNPT